MTEAAGIAGVEGGSDPRALVPRWRVVARAILTWGFFALVVTLLIALARNIDWTSVLRTLRNTSWVTLGLGALVALCSHLVYATFDVLGKVYTRHHLPISRILPITFVCYVFNLNLSAWVGAIATRYRLYSRLGLPAAVIAKVFTLSLMTNWLGYFALAGVLFVSGHAPAMQADGLWSRWLRVLGGALLAVVAVYLAACAFSQRRSFRLRKQQFELPRFRFAILQIVLGATNWSLMALTIFVLLGGGVGYPTVLGALLVSAVAGLVAHIPAGLGVLEAVFVALLAGRMDETRVLAALIGYRVVYFLLPLLAATLIFVVLETRGRRRRVPSPSA